MMQRNELMRLAQMQDGSGGQYSRPPERSMGGTDMDMMMMYGPEDQVAFDQMGRPIPLSDPRHPRNQQQTPPQQMRPASAYPQQRR